MVRGDGDASQDDGGDEDTNTSDKRLPLTSHLLGVKGSQVQILSSRQKALVRGNFHQGFVVSGDGHWLVHSLDLLDPVAVEVDQSRFASSPAKCTRRCPWSGEYSTP